MVQRSMTTRSPCRAVLVTSLAVTSPVLMVPWLALAVVTASLVARWMFRWSSRGVVRVAGVVVAVVVGVGVGAGLLLAWGSLNLERSSVARAVMWRGADVDDIHRFVERPVRAPADSLVLRPAPASRAIAPDAQIAPGQSVVDLVSSTSTSALIVLRGEEILLELYDHGGGVDVPHTSFSVAKSVLASLVAIAVDRGELGSLEDPITAYVPELAERDERFAEVSLGHLVDMTSGIRYRENGMPWGDDATTYYAPDLRAAAVSVSVDGPPGIEWHYNNYNPLLVGLALERATGMSVSAYTEKVLWGPMGAGADASWSLDSERHGFEKMESGFNALPHDFARFGLLYARGGVRDGRAVLPDGWVDELVAPGAGGANEEYRRFWWFDSERPGRIYARGNFGQYVYVDPATEVVVVRLGRKEGSVDWPSLLRQLADHAS